MYWLYEADDDEIFPDKDVFLRKFDIKYLTDRLSYVAINSIEIEHGIIQYKMILYTNDNGIVHLELIEDDKTGKVLIQKLESELSPQGVSRATSIAKEVGHYIVKYQNSMTSKFIKKLENKVNPKSNTKE